MVSLSPLEADVTDVCFCHWPVDPYTVGDHLPGWTTAETADGDAWVTAMWYRASVRSFGRTLDGPTPVVTVQVPVRGPNDQRGSYPLAVFTPSGQLSRALSLFSLPVRDATVGRTDREGRVRRELTVGTRQLLAVEHDPVTSTPGRAPPDSLAAFLADRERYFVAGALGTPLIGSAGPTAWRLRGVRGSVTERLLEWVGVDDLGEGPLVHVGADTTLALGPPVPAGVDSA